MFSKQYRLKNKKLFNRIYKNGQRFRTDNFGLCFLKNDLESPRFGIVISNKVEPLAVRRNKIKRQIREKIKADYLKIPIIKLQCSIKSQM